MNTTIDILVFIAAFAAASYVTGVLRSIVRHLDRIATCLEKGGRLLDGAKWQFENTVVEKD